MIQPTPGQPTAPETADGQPRLEQPQWTVGTALAAFVLSVLVVPAIVALPLAIVTLVAMRRTAGHWRGLAVAATVISSVSLFMVLPTATFLLVTAGDVQRNDSGVVVKGGTVEVFEARVGDCFTEDDQNALYTLDLVPCREAHGSEIYALPMLTGEYPGDREIEELAEQLCADEFSQYVGAELKDSTLLFSYFYPDRQAWSNPANLHLVCFVTDKDGEQIHGSVKGSGR